MICEGRLAKKRRGQDSNLRTSFPVTDLANRRFRPLSHLSGVEGAGESGPVCCILDTGREFASPSWTHSYRGGCLLVSVSKFVTTPTLAASATSRGGD